MVKIIHRLSISIFTIYFLIILSFLIIYPVSTFMGIFPFLTNILFVGMFLITFNNLIRIATKTSYDIFLKIMFGYSLFYSFVYICLQYLLSYYYTPELFPYDVGITDNYEYIANGLFFKLVLEGGRSLDSFMKNTGLSDQGFPIW